MNGIYPAILQHLSVVAGKNDQTTKITPAGLLLALVDKTPNLALSSLKIGNENLTANPGMKLNTNFGQVRDVKLKYLPRLTEDLVTEEDSCEPNAVFGYR